jgi:hypothetical protein
MDTKRSAEKVRASLGNRETMLSEFSILLASKPRRRCAVPDVATPEEDIRGLSYSNGVH